MKQERLERDAIENWLGAHHPLWRLDPEATRISRQFKFANFIEAFGFMSECAILAEKIDHHPEWSNVYSRVDVVLTTHDVKGITQLDFKLAAFMDRAASRR